MVFDCEQKVTEFFQSVFSFIEEFHAQILTESAMPFSLVQSHSEIMEITRYEKLIDEGLVSTDFAIVRAFKKFFGVYPNPSVMVKVM
jgi:hypothetical protein